MRKTKGITLIALVITIIILLILAGVSISLMIGDSGILSKANSSKQKTDEGQTREQIRLAAMAARASDEGLITEESLNTELINTFGEGNFTLEENDENSWKVTANGVSEVILKSSIVENQSYTVDFENKMAEAKANRVGYEAIGIDKDGEPVDMNLWYYVDKNDHISLGDRVYLGSTDYNYIPGYMGEIIEGKIIGTIPQFVIPEGRDDFLPVTELTCAFCNNNELIFAPQIPSTVIYMNYTFYNCPNLTNAPDIPYNVIGMVSTFSNCKSLTYIPPIPNNVRDLSYTFSYCDSLTETPKLSETIESLNGTFSGCRNLVNINEIPNSVTDMYSTFSGCNGLTETPKLPSNLISMRATFQYCNNLTKVNDLPDTIEDMSYAFWNCDNLVEISELPTEVKNISCSFMFCTSLIDMPTIPEQVTNMRETFYGCSSLTNATNIPASVTNMNSTFHSCKKLSGELKIDANVIVEKYYWNGYEQIPIYNNSGFFYNTSTDSNAKLLIYGECDQLDLFLSTKSSNSHISLK